MSTHIHLKYYTACVKKTVCGLPTARTRASSARHVNGCVSDALLNAAMQNV